MCYLIRIRDPKGTFHFRFKIKTNFENFFYFRFSFHFGKRISNQFLFLVLQMKNYNQTQIFGKIFSPTHRRHLNPWVEMDFRSENESKIDFFSFFVFKFELKNGFQFNFCFSISKRKTKNKCKFLATFFLHSITYLSVTSIPKKILIFFINFPKFDYCFQIENR